MLRNLLRYPYAPECVEGGFRAMATYERSRSAPSRWGARPRLLGFRRMMVWGMEADSTCFTRTRT